DLRQSGAHRRGQLRPRGERRDARVAATQARGGRMIDLLPGGSSAPPGLRRPQFSIAFGSGGGGGALGGLGSAVADAVGLGGGADDPWKRNLVSLTLNLGLAPMVDALELVLMG